MKARFSLKIGLQIFLSLFCICLITILFFPSGIIYGEFKYKDNCGVLNREFNNYPNNHNYICTNQYAIEPFKENPAGLSPTGIPYKDIIDLYARSALIMNYDTAEVLWEKEPGLMLFPASITKIITAIIVIENTRDFDDVVTISRKASGRNNSFFRFETGDKITVMDLLKAALISSHNNATIALAEYIAGDDGIFVEMMNGKAGELGALNTNFENTNGLDSDFPEHKSTAYDLALIARYCMHNQLFRDLVSKKSDIIKINDEEISLENTNALLSFDYVKGIKTGYTENAGYCIINYSEKDGLNLITVVLGSTRERREADAMNLMNWAYSNLQYKKLVDSRKIFNSIMAGNDSLIALDIYPGEDLVRLVHKSSDLLGLEYKLDEDIKIPLERNSVLGELMVSINDNPVASIDLVNRDSIEKPVISQELTTAEERQSKLILIFLIAFYFLIFIFIIFKNLFMGKNF